MTSYTIESYEKTEYTYSIELRTQNNRYQDILIHLPPDLRRIENTVRKMIQHAIHRGSIDISVQIRYHDNESTLRINTELVNKLKEFQITLSENTHSLSIADIIAFDKTLIYQERPLPETDEILASIAQTLTKCREIQKQEGDAILARLREYITSLTAGVKNIRKQVPIVESMLAKTVEKYFTQWVHEVDKQHMYQEIAALTIKASIEEELVLLDSHLISMGKDIAQNTSPIGKRLDFICQEINRELHTIGSKTPNPVIHKEVLSMRESIENMRELLRNIQ